MKIISKFGEQDIVLPMENALLYAEFNNDNSLRLFRNRVYTIKKVASKGVKAKRDVYKGTGGLLFFVSPRFYRGEVDPDKATRRKKGFRDYLGETEDINTSHKSISAIAQEIRNQLPEQHRNNAYLLTRGLCSWIGENISRTPIPPSISKLFDEHDTKKLIRCYNSNSDDISLKLLFGSFWEEESSAQRTLEERAGKCVGLSNLFVALSRNLGIPSITLRGYYSDAEYWKTNATEGFHQWAASYIHPYGWIEIDPTHTSDPFFKNSDYDHYAYLFAESDNPPGFTIVERGHGFVSPTKIDNITRLLEEDKNWFDRVFRKDRRDEIFKLLEERMY